MCGRIVRWAVGKVGFVALFSVSIVVLGLVFFDWSVLAVSSSIVISQIYGGGGNSGATYKNDFIEVFNLGPTTVNVAGWSVQHTSAAGTSWSVTSICPTGPCNIAPGKYFLVQEAQGAGGTTNLPTPDATGIIAMGASSGKVALVNNSTALSGSGCPFSASVVDFVGYGSGTTCSETSASAAPSNTTSVFRKTNGCTETDNNNSDFATGVPNPRNSSSATVSCNPPTNPTGGGSANPNTLAAGGTTLLRVAVTPGSFPTSTGITVTGDLSAIGGSAAQPFFDDGTHGDVTIGDNTFSYQTTVTLGTSGGTKNLPLTINDAQARTGTTSITLNISFASRSLVISEVAWMGTSFSSSDEWIELYNNTSAAINLSGWTLTDGGDINISLSGTIPSDEFFLLERTDEATVSDITADKIYTGSLSNSGESLTLKDSTNTVIDTANGNGGAWPAGDDTSRSTMERINLADADSDTNWATNDGAHRNGLDAHSNPINGTPKAQNSTLLAPTVEIISPTAIVPRYAKQGTSFSVSFTTDKAGSYELKVSGTLCGTGSVSAGTNSKTCTLPGAFTEGAKDLSAGVTANSLTGSDAETGAVLVDNTAPTLSVNAAAGGNPYTVDTWSNQTITVTFSCADPVSNGISSGVAAGNPTGNKTLTAETSGTTVNGSCMDQAGNSAILSFGPVKIDKTAPKVRLVSPNGGELIYATGIFPIAWTLCTDALSGPSTNPIALSFSTDGGATFPHAIATEEANDGVYDWATANVDSNAVRVQVSCTDKANNVGKDVSNANFTLTTGPDVNATLEDANEKTNDDTVYAIGDTIKYTVVLKNNSTTGPVFDRADPEFIDQITDTRLIPTALGKAASSGTISFDASTKTFSWNGSIPPGRSVTLTYFAQIITDLRRLGGLRPRVCNQGIATFDKNLDGIHETSVQTSDPTTLVGAGTKTCSDVSSLRPQSELRVTALRALWLSADSAIHFEALGMGIKEIDVQIFSLSGKRVYRSGWVENGYEWRLQSTNGKLVANGVYLYVVTVRGYDGKMAQTQVKKFVIVR